MSDEGSYDTPAATPRHSDLYDSPRVSSILYDSPRTQLSVYDVPKVLHWIVGIFNI